MLEILKASKIFPNQRLPSHFLEIEGKVSVVCIPGKGRGLFAKQVFNPGDLIIGHRALEIIFPDSAATVPSSILLSRVKRFRCLKESLAKLASTDEEVRRKLYFLHAGPKLGFVGGDEREVKKSISLARIEGVILVNGFQGPSTRVGETGGPFGLWYLPSFINHDCSRANANWNIVNDFIFIIAAKQICVGDEILISYIDPDQPYAVRNELLLKHDFICTCKLCNLERDEGESIRRQRDTILAKFKNHVDSISSNFLPDVQLLSSILEELKFLRRDLPLEENPFVLQPMMQLGLALFERNKYNEAIPLFEDAIKLCRRLIQFSSVATTLSIAVLKCYLNLTPENTSTNYEVTIKNWIYAMRDCIIIQYGSRQGDDDEWRGILELRMPGLLSQIEPYLK
ncbi:uncharacterized protein LOC110860680 [Folsomia candida]|uniref:SET domain-containing protein 5 n=1 Tax=Folsomia candida TaxID=158441 RepID=A0A226D4E4_FOLCA|nr:uncharacterized protein LOC110860680 [Folsomia candida]OXA40435.1 SET domain-containing protein 5 [Folsomia candida]